MLTLWAKVERQGRNVNTHLHRRIHLDLRRTAQRGLFRDPAELISKRCHPTAAALRSPLIICVVEKRLSMPKTEIRSILSRSQPTLPSKMPFGSRWFRTIRSLATISASPASRSSRLGC